MAKQIIYTVSIGATFTQAEKDYIEKIRCNPSDPDYIELYLAGIL